jgi:hypothetical protein
MKQPNYTDHAITESTKLLGFESNSPQQTFNYPAFGAFVPFIPSNAKQFIGIINQSGSINGPSLTPMTGTVNQIGQIVGSVRDSAGDYRIEFDPGTFEFGTLYVFVGAPESGGVSPSIIQMSKDSSDLTYSKLRVSNYNVFSGTNEDGLNFPIHIILA